MTCLALALASCSEQRDVQHDALLAQLEGEVQLPKGAAKLEEYARYYAARGDNIVGVYTTLVDPRNSNYDLQIGQRRWLAGPNGLPLLMDGGCSVVEVTFNAASKKVEDIFCHGEA